MLSEYELTFDICISHIHNQSIIRFLRECQGVSMIIDHIGLAVSDHAQSKGFYSKALAPLGVAEVMAMEGWSGFGKDKKPEFWFGVGRGVQQPTHIAFSADNRQQVDKFYEAALAVGGKDNGAPGIREDYHPNYYAAFVFDPDGHNIEVVCHKPE